MYPYLSDEELMQDLEQLEEMQRINDLDEQKEGDGWVD